MGRPLRPALYLAAGFAAGACLVGLPAALPEPSAPRLASIYLPEPATDITARRDRLRAAIWPGGFPADTGELERRGDTLIVRTAGLESRIAVHAGGPAAVIYHAGHGGDEADTERARAAFRAAGHTVLVMHMPLTWPNPAPTLDIAGVGRVHLWRHDLIPLLPGVHPLRPFLHPIAVAVRWLHAHGHPDVTVVGFSGGGWATTVAAALDPGIARSYAVAGTLPVALSPVEPRDMEQLHPDLLAAGGYAALYAMAAAEGRAHVQIHNLRDPCCFRPPEDGAALARIAHATGARFVVDSTHAGHAISDWALRWILADMEAPAW